MMIMVTWVIGASLLASLEPVVTSEHLLSQADDVRKAQRACGPTSVWYSLRRHGRDVQLGEIRQMVDLQKDGVSVADLTRLFAHFGVDAQALTIDVSKLDTLAIPSILIINASHCIVYEGFESVERIKYYEPALDRHRTVKVPELLKQWTGDVVVFDRPRMTSTTFASLVLGTGLATFASGAFLRRGLRKLQRK